MLPVSIGQLPVTMTKAIDEIPLDIRKKICTEIDFSIVQRNGYWDHLVSELGFTESDSKNFQLAFAKSQSPAENLLRECSYRNYRIGTLSNILKRIGLVKLAEENLDNLGERRASPTYSHVQWPGMQPLNGRGRPRRPTDSDSTNSSHSTSDSDKIGGLDTIHYPYQEIVKGTNNFSPDMKLGAGAFGKVYKVNLKNTIFACKVLTINNDGPHFSIVSKHKEQSDLKNELRYLAEYRHPNIIPLYGWSLDGKDPCLIYQYMKNGSLQDCLQRLHGNMPLLWRTRIKVACDAARGLQFLHRAKEKPLIHGDIKTANILLDDSFGAKLGDFGLAREGPRSHVTGSYIKLNDEHTPGTLGYLAIEYMQGKKLSVQVDTYAFGVVLLELYTGRRAFDRTQNKAGTLLRDYMDDIANGMGDGGPKQAEDRLFEHQSPEIFPLPRKIALRFVRIALECCHEKRNKRPAMSATLERLEALSNELESLPQLGQMIPTVGEVTPCSTTTSRAGGRTPVESVDYSFRNHDSNLDQSKDFLSLPHAQATNEALKQLRVTEKQEPYMPQHPTPPPNIFGAYAPTTHQYINGPMYPHHVMAVNRHPSSIMHWGAGDTGVANYLSPVFSLIPSPHNIPHQMGPYLSFTPTPFSDPNYPLPHCNMSNIVRMPASSDSDDSSGAKLSRSTTPGMLSTPEAFSSLEDQARLSPSVVSRRIQIANANGAFPSSAQLNPFPYHNLAGAYAANHGIRRTSDPCVGDLGGRAPFVPEKTAPPTTIPLKVNPVKADMLARLSRLNDTTDDADLSEFFP